MLIVLVSSAKYTLAEIRFVYNVNLKIFESFLQEIIFQIFLHRPGKNHIHILQPSSTKMKCCRLKAYALRRAIAKPAFYIATNFELRDKMSLLNSCYCAPFKYSLFAW